MADNILLCCPNNYALRGWRVACHACVEKYLMQHSQHGQVLLKYTMTTQKDMRLRWIVVQPVLDIHTSSIVNLDVHVGRR